MNENRSLSTIIRVVACVLIAVLSITIITPKMSSPETYKGTIEKLDEKEKVVMAVTAAATASSIGLAAFPDDATTPVANKIMDLVGYLVLVLSAIIMEKYLLTMAGYLVFKWLVPLVCLILLINIFAKNSSLMKFATKVLILSLAILLVVPFSVRVSDFIEETYEISNTKSDEETILEIEKIEDTETTADTEADEEEVNEAEDKSGNFLKRALGNASSAANDAKEKAKEMAEKAVTYVTDVTSDTIEKAQDMLWSLVEKVVVLIVTNCVLPIVVMVFLLWIINLITGIQINVPDPKKITKNFHKKIDMEE